VSAVNRIGGSRLSGGRFGGATRHGVSVSRSRSPAAANIHTLLDHLAESGFALSPGVLADGDSAGRERLSFVPGSAGLLPLTAPVRSERALRSAARAVRALHDATQGYWWSVNIRGLSYSSG
jgi:hypothetical protein